MEHYFHHEISVLKNRLLEMGGRAEAAVRKALAALETRDDDAARQVIQDDSVVDQCELEVDDMGARLLAQAPLASDLRLIIVALKISHDLERVGDEATTMARRALELNREPRLKAGADIPRMAGLALQMLDDALDAFVQRDCAKARTVVPRDKEVDLLNKQLHRELAGFMAANPAAIPGALNLMVISKCLERIADHAKNIAEEVVFLYEGRDIRHGGRRQAPQSL